MAKRTIHRGKGELNIKGIAIIIAIVAATFILYTNMLAILIATFGTLIIVVVILIIGAYYVLPRLGITGLAALLSFGKK